MGVLKRGAAAAVTATARLVFFAVFGLLAVGAGGALAGSVAGSAAQHVISIVDQHGEPLEYAVVELLPAQGAAGNRLVAPEPRTVVQENRTFTPFVSAVVAGTELGFPNLDKTRHHVYSFSEAKPFELKLFVGHNHAPVLFDRPGIVVIGCNIHDYMQAYIYVADASRVAVSNESGKAAFADLPAGPYSAKLWHPWANETPQTIRIEAGTLPEQIEIPITRRPLPAPPQGGLQNLFQP